MPLQCGEVMTVAHMQRCPHPHQTAMVKEMALEHPSVRILLGSTDQEILDAVEQVYRGQYKMVLSVLPCQCQDQSMVKLHEELGQCLVRAALCGAMRTAWSLSRGRRHSWALSSSWARSPSAESRRKEVAKWLRGDSLMRNSWPYSRCSRRRVQQHQSQSPGHQQTSEAPPQLSMRPHRHTPPSPIPLYWHCMDEWLHHSLSKLHLQPQWQESRRRGLAGHGQTMLQWCHRMPPFPTRISNRVFTPGPCKETGPFQPGWHTAITHWLDLLLMCGLTLHAHLSPQPQVFHGHLSMVLTSIMPTLLEEPSQRLAPLHQASLQLPVKLGSDVEYTRPHKVLWVVDPGAHGQEQAAPLLVVRFQVLYIYITGWLNDGMVQQIARKQAVALRLPAVQEEVVGWWEAPLGVHDLGW